MLELLSQYVMPPNLLAKLNIFTVNIILNKDLELDPLQVRIRKLPALTCDGYIDWVIHHGAINAELFTQFLEERVLPNCSPYPGKMSVIIMDNASIHKNPRIREICDNAGVLLVFLPPYSPDFNPIESTFKDLKAWIKKHYQQAVSPLSLVQQYVNLFKYGRPSMDSILQEEAELRTCNRFKRRLIMSLLWTSQS
jgi:transposase